MRGVRETVYFDRPQYAPQVWAITNIEVDASGLAKHLKMYAEVMGMQAQKVIKKQAALLCEDLMDFTMPIVGNSPERRSGRTNLARQRGIDRMERDIDRVFKPLHSASYGDISRQDSFAVFSAWVASQKKENRPLPGYLNGQFGIGEWDKFRSAYSKEDSYYTGAEIRYDSVFASPTSIEAKHTALKGGMKAKNYRTNMRRLDEVILIDNHASKMEAYKKKMRLRVGQLKSGWYHAGMAIGYKKIDAPYWISSHPSYSGTLFSALEDKSYPYLEVGNKLHGKMTIGPGFTMWKHALNRRAYAMRLDMARRLNNKSPEKLLEIVDRLNQTGMFEAVYDAPF